MLSGVGGLQEVSARDSLRGEFPTGAKPPTLLQHFATWLLCNAPVLKGLLSNTGLRGTFTSSGIPLHLHSSTCVCSTLALPEQMHHCKSDVWDECRRGAVQAGGAPTDASWSP